MPTIDFLIRRNNSPEAFPGAVGYQRGDIVGWRVQPHSGFGAAEDPDNFPSAADCGFVIVTILGVPDDAAILDRLEEAEEDPAQVGRLVRRRLRGLSWADLPNNVKNRLQNNGRVTRQWSGVRSWLKNKVTGETE